MAENVTNNVANAVNATAALGVTKARVGGNEYVVSSGWTLDEITAALGGIGVQVDGNASTRIEDGTLIFEGTTQAPVQNFGTKG